MGSRVFVLLALALLVVPTSMGSIPSPSQALDSPQSYDWVPRTSPSGHYVYFTQISTPYGVGYHVDSIGNSQFAYDFMGCTNETFTVACDGSLTVWGWFRQSDTFDLGVQPSRRHLLIYVLYADSPEFAAKTIVALTCDDGTDWKFRNMTICGLCPGKLAWIGVGRDDHWQSEWNQAAEWADVHISEDPAGPSWRATSCPGGHGFTFYDFMTPFGLGYHIDSVGYVDYSYDFYGYTDEVFTVGRSGVIRVRGWFRQYDTWEGTYLKEVNIFVVNSANPDVYSKWVTVLDYTDGYDWEYRDAIIGGLVPGSQVRIGIGRHDGWATDWGLTAEWACVEILPENFDYPSLGLRWNLDLGYPSNSSPAVADVDSDGSMEAVVGTIDGYIHCVHALIGQWDWFYQIQGSHDPRPAIGDVDGDNKLEIVVTTDTGEVYCLEGSGAVKWNRSLGSAILAVPTLADIDADGRKEIIVGSNDGQVSCLDGEGTPKWHHQIGGQIKFSSPCCADFDGDNKTEIMIGSLDHTLYCLNSSGGLEWSCITPGEISDPTIASDVNNDGKPEVIAATSNGWIYCVNGDGGIVWDFKVGEEITSPLAVEDINHDGAQEMLVMVGPGFCNLTCISYLDGLKWTRPIGGPASYIPVIADFNSGSSRPEILLNCGGTLNCLSSEGGMEWGLQAAQYMVGCPVVSDIDNDNVKEIMLMGESTLRCYDYDSAPPARLWVIVTDAHGGALANAFIISTSSPVGQWTISGSTTSDGDGHISFISLVSGSYSFLVRHLGYDDVYVSIFLGDSSTQTLHVALSASSETPHEIPTLMIVSSAVLILLILGVFGLVIRRSGDRGSGSSPVYSSQRNASRPATAPAEEPITSVHPPPTCPNCGAAIRYSTARYCQSCGAILETIMQTGSPDATKAGENILELCIVCGLGFRDTGDTVKCPYCGRVAHRVHMLEWLHVNDYCPACRRHLEERDLQTR